jgi:hypothetical protein
VRKGEVESVSAYVAAALEEKAKLEDLAVSLTRRHGQLGLAIGERTAVSRWAGEGTDYNWAVGALQRRAAWAPARA